ncbi:MAG: hypothetical protein LBN32_01010 [Helicobacteraceae bacterium]|jgi:DNA repair protein RadA/Sms|nr:hypothetical protein [Helicobacteraceae bacterium]
MEKKQSRQESAHYNLNVERALLSTILSDQSIGEYLENITPEQFYFLDHQHIFTAMIELKNRSQPINDVFVKNELKRLKLEVSDETFFDVIATSALPDGQSAYVTLFTQLYKKRCLIDLSKKVISHIDQYDSSDETLAFAKKQLDEIDKIGDINTRAKCFDDLAKEEKDRQPLTKYETGVSFLDDPLRGGIEEGQLVLIGGDPEAGKTMLATQIMKNITKAHRVVFFCFEFTVRKFVILQCELQKNYQNPNLFVIDDAYDISDIEREIRIWSKRGAKMFVIDSQMKIENVMNKGTVEERETDKFARLAKLAHRLNLIVVLIVQTSKADTAAGLIVPHKSKNAAHEASIFIYLKKIKDKEGYKEMRLFTLHKNKQTGIHFSKEVIFKPTDKTFVRPYAPTTKVVTHAAASAVEMPDID